jgi:hypothetical protein
VTDEVLTVVKVNCQHLEELLEVVCCDITERDETNIARGFRRLNKIALISC